VKFGSGPRRKDLINITPLIDVVFLLLLFYVVTSTFLERSGLDLTLPAASTSEAARRDEVTLELDAGGGTWLDGRTVEPAMLEGAIREALAAGATKRVVLEADEQVVHGRVVEAMDAARRAGATGLVVATRPRDEPVPAP
jgi:biopolymer transport protein ExbD